MTAEPKSNRQEAPFTEPYVRERIWMQQAYCKNANPDEFINESPDVQAKTVGNYCVRCSVRLECLAYALLTKQKFGVWGGTTDEERKELNKQEVLDTLIQQSYET